MHISYTALKALKFKITLRQIEFPLLTTNEQNSLKMNSGNDAAALFDFSSGSLEGRNNIKRSDFPSDFIFGSATSAYQVEGAWATGGKSQSIWDVFTMKTPGKIQGGANACVAIDQYNRWKEDVALLKKVGLDSYRFSIAWSRVLPGGKLYAGINKEGIKYYNDLINLLLAEGIEPCVTIFHWDVPQHLDEEYGGFLSPRIVKDFGDFAELCFWEFGDRVKYWITLNEPSSMAIQGYATGTFAPGRGSTSAEPVKAIPPHRCELKAPTPCPSGNPGTEPYIVAHNMILSHAKAVDIYRKRYQAHQGGKIGITNVAQWYEPLTDTKADKEAASRALDFILGWFLAPIVTGGYPPVMRKLVGNRLPQFTQEQAKLVKGSYDFLGINYYTSTYASNSPRQSGTAISYSNDQDVALSSDRDGTPIGPQAGSSWLSIVPNGIYKLLVYIKKTYDNPIIYITENGVDEVNNSALTVSEARFDETRIKYHQDHLFYVKKAMEEGVDVKAYFVWSMFDNFELAAGYSVRFGLFYVDFVNGYLTRFPKTSALWLMNFLDKKRITLKRQAPKNEEEHGSTKKVKKQ
ncbi:raucaffricine-O-beta-D-glucosidase-like isoform X3 [Olea europaea var. sylvestris]|uniref:raucaffricine-O-beta-D-glucosidase-like isoform X3 n=1 Tax=Olea europaea var. sylvestris TaxID=158386 RepID=UPI000C1CFA87|nr:raucaffricine-O-beta-D-glucosidase-like isoform X3 [Olea europaea var. sylvestris]